MKLRETLERSDTLDRKLSDLVFNLKLPNSDRCRAAGGAFMVALDAHTSIIRLLRAGNTPSAFMLSRSIWEAVVRGFWLFESASDVQLAKFIEDRLDRKSWHMIQDLEASGGFDANTLSEIHAANSKRLNAMNHVGGPLIVRCNSERGVEYNFTDQEKMECLNHASAIAALAAVGLAQLADDITLGQRIFALQDELFGQHSI